MELLLEISSLKSWIAGLVILLAVYYWVDRIINHYWKMQNVPAGYPYFSCMELPIFMGKKTLYEVEMEQYKKYGRVSGLYNVSGQPRLMIGEPELLRLIFVKDFQSFTDKISFASDSFVGKMVLFLEGEDWKRTRNIVSPAFTFTKIKRFEKQILSCVDSLTTTLVHHADSDKTINMKSVFGHFSLDVIASTAFGMQINCIQNSNCDFVSYTSRMLTDRGWRMIIYVFLPFLVPIFQLNLFNPKITNYFKDIVFKMKEDRLKTGKVGEDFLQLLMDAECDEPTKEMPSPENGAAIPKTKNNKLSSDELASQITQFLIAGHESTGTSLSMVAYFLATNQECQKTLLREIDAVWAEHGKVDADTVNNMEYLESVISETLRLIPPAPRVERTCTRACKLGETGISVPKGMVVTCPIYSIHRDPEFFPEPDTFKPERFMPENKNSIKPYTYMPFGSGPRNCVGMRLAQLEMKLCLVHILRQVTFHTCSETKFPPAWVHRTNMIRPLEITLQLKTRKLH